MTMKLNGTPKPIRGVSGLSMRMTQNFSGKGKIKQSSA